MFLVQTDKDMVNRIDFLNTAIIPTNLDTYMKRFYTLPDSMVIPIDMKENCVFPDILLRPYPMVSEMIMDVMRMYRVEPFFRKVLLSVRNSDEYKQYFLLYVDEKTISLFRDFEIRRKPDTKNGLNCIISLDFAESILRRGAQGIVLSEIDETEEYAL